MFVILTLVVMEVSVINLMRMLLAKATSRAAEIGIHRALGAGRNAIFSRQLLEGVLVSMVGSVLGLALAVPTVAMFDRLIPDLPIQLAVTPRDRRDRAAGLPARRAGERHLPRLADRLRRAHALPREDMNPSLELGPILRSMRHHKGAFSLLVLEVALGFVMLTHTMIAVRYYFRLHVGSTGIARGRAGGRTAPLPSPARRRGGAGRRARRRRGARSHRRPPRRWRRRRCPTRRRSPPR